MKKITLLLLVAIFCSQLVSAQRYVEEIFTDVEVTEDVTYGVNATLLFLSVTGEAVPQALNADIYTPAGDTETDRPLVIFFHTGNFLPPTFNGGCGGTRKDADVVEMAKKMARMGYVAACVDYRLGWDPTNPEQTTRVFTIINASYRGVQDSRTAIKFFRRTVAEQNNPFGIDDSKIALWGFGTGAYVTYGSATLQATEDTYLPQFLTPAGPMVNPMFNGDVSAGTVGVVPIEGLGVPAGDTLCYPNHVGYDDSFSLAVQMGGANGSAEWVNDAENDVPMISYHVTTDPFAPYNTGIVNVPPPVNLPVIEVSGAGVIIPLANEIGINDALTGNGMYAYDDGISEYVNSINGGNEGLFPFFSDDPTESAPWNYTYSSEPYGVEGSDCPLLNDDIASVRDSVVSYFVPRACVVLGLDCDLSGYTGVNDLDENQVGLTMSPNPAKDMVQLTTVNEPIQEILILNSAGTLLSHTEGINAYNYTIQRNNVASGMYVAMLKFKDGYVTKKFIFN